jgi:hypothetical protein
MSEYKEPAIVVALRTENDRLRVERDALAAELAALKKPDPLADYQEQVAAIVHAAMRFERDDVTPEWQAGNSHAEYRARQAATEIASMLRCAVKSNDPLAEMWRELKAYQPQADRDGHGESWRRMCEERTQAAAWVAQRCATRPAAKDAADCAASAAWAAARHAESAGDAIDAIRRAKEAR